MSEIRVDNFKAEDGISAPSFPNGIQVTGVITATSLQTSVDFLDVGSNIKAGNAGILTVTQLDATKVSIAGTLTYEDVTSVDSVGLVTAREGVFIPDSKEIKIGNTAGSPDMKIYHDGSHSFVDNTTGLLILQDTSGMYLRTDDLRLQTSGGSETYATLTKDGAVSLNYDNNTKFATTNSGATVTGSLTATSFIGDGSSLTGIDATSIKDSGGNVKVQAQASGAMYTGIHTYTGHTFHQDGVDSKYGTDGDMAIYHDGSNAYIKEHSNNMHIGSWATGGNKGLYFYSAGTNRAAFNNDGNFVPAANNTYDLGISSLRWANIFTQDLQLSNEGKKDEGGNDVDGTWGDYTIQEGESDLFLINNRNGKKYKFMLKEVN